MTCSNSTLTHDHQFAAQDSYVAALMCDEVGDSSFMEQVETLVDKFGGWVGGWVYNIRSQLHSAILCE